MFMWPFLLAADQVACVVPSECQKFCGRRTGCSTLAYPVLVLGVMPSGKKWALPPRATWLSLERQVGVRIQVGFLTNQPIILHVEAVCVLGAVSTGASLLYSGRSIGPCLPSNTGSVHPHGGTTCTHQLYYLCHLLIFFFPENPFLVV